MISVLWGSGVMECLYWECIFRAQKSSICIQSTLGFERQLIFLYFWILTCSKAVQVILYLCEQKSDDALRYDPNHTSHDDIWRMLYPDAFTPGGLIPPAILKSDCFLVKQSYTATNWLLCSLCFVIFKLKIHIFYNQCFQENAFENKDNEPHLLIQL